MTHFTSPEDQVAAKTHECDGCRRTIDVGERYWRGRGYDGGDAWTWRWCEHCSALVALYDIEAWVDDLGLTPEDIDGWADEQIVYDWSRIEVDWTRQRHAAGWKMRWRTRAGTLLPVPAKALEGAR